MLDQEYVRERFDYNEDTGVLTWRFLPPINKNNKNFNTGYAGKVAGSLDTGIYSY